MLIRFNDYIYTFTLARSEEAAIRRLYRAKVKNYSGRFNRLTPREEVMLLIADYLSDDRTNDYVVRIRNSSSS